MIFESLHDFWTLFSNSPKKFVNFQHYKIFFICKKFTMTAKYESLEIFWRFYVQKIRHLGSMYTNVDGAFHLGYLTNSKKSLTNKNFY